MPTLERVVRWGNSYAGRNRKGEHCTILSMGTNSSQVQVRFEDGEVAIVDRRALTLTGKTRAQREPPRPT